MDHYLTLIQESTKYGLKTYLKPQAMKVLEENIEKILWYAVGKYFLLITSKA